MNEFLSSKLFCIRCLNMKLSFICANILVINIGVYTNWTDGQNINDSHKAFLLNWSFFLQIGTQ